MTSLKACGKWSWLILDSVTLFLGVLANFRKATIHFFVSACPFVPMEQLGCHWLDFHEVCY
jgi:hypothetical protein